MRSAQPSPGLSPTAEALSPTVQVFLNWLPLEMKLENYMRPLFSAVGAEISAASLCWSQQCIATLRRPQGEMLMSEGLEWAHNCKPRVASWSTSSKTSLSIGPTRRHRSQLLRGLQVCKT